MSSNRQEGCDLHTVMTVESLIRVTDPRNYPPGEVVTSYRLSLPNWDADEDDPYDDDDDDEEDDDDAFDDEPDEDDDDDVLDG